MQPLALLQIEHVSLVPFQTRSRQIPECGVKRYNASEGEVCGIKMYRLLSSSACTPIYPLGTGSVCGMKYEDDKYLKERLTRTWTRSPTTGAIFDITRNECRRNTGEVLYTTELDIPCARYCQSVGKIGSSHHNYNVISDGTPDFFGNRTWIKEWDRLGSCTIYSTCRSPQFGGPVGYESCRDPSHGAESYHSCEHSSFGVAEYNSCPVIKDRFELSVYIDVSNQV